NRQRVVATAGDGVYTAPGLPPGVYRIDAELPGFTTIRRERVRVSTGEQVRVDFDLVVGGLREQVTVAAPARIVRGETGRLGTLGGPLAKDRTFSSPIIRGSVKRSHERRPPPCRRCSSGRGSSRSPSAAARPSSTTRQQRLDPRDLPFRATRFRTTSWTQWRW